MGGGWLAGWLVVGCWVWIIGFDIHTYICTSPIRPIARRLFSRRLLPRPGYLIPTPPPLSKMVVRLIANSAQMIVCVMGLLPYFAKRDEQAARCMPRLCCSGSTFPHVLGRRELSDLRWQAHYSAAIVDSLLLDRCVQFGDIQFAPAPAQLSCKTSAGADDASPLAHSAPQNQTTFWKLG